MLIPCTILKPFPYSEDGFTTKRAEAGKMVDIPANLIEGLARGGYLRAATAGEMQGKALGASPENKMSPGAPENKHPLDHDGDGRPGGSIKPEQTDDLHALRAAYQAKFGKRPFMGWDAADLAKRVNGDG